MADSNECLHVESCFVGFSCGRILIVGSAIDEFDVEVLGGNDV